MNRPTFMIVKMFGNNFPTRHVYQCLNILKAGHLMIQRLHSLVTQ